MIKMCDFFLQIITIIPAAVIEGVDGGLDTFQQKEEGDYFPTV